MHKQCEFFSHSVNYNEKDDTSYASWGSMLMHLSMVHEQQVCSPVCGVFAVREMTFSARAIVLNACVLGARELSSCIVHCLGVELICMWGRARTKNVNT